MVAENETFTKFKSGGRGSKNFDSNAIVQTCTLGSKAIKVPSMFKSILSKRTL